MREFVEKLKNWIINRNGIYTYRDEYNNYCYGNNKYKHIFHLHNFNTNADIEISDKQMFQDFLEKYGNIVTPHSWHPDSWLIVDLTNEKNYNIAKIIISKIIG